MAKYRKKPVEIEAFQFDGDFINSKGQYCVPKWVVYALVLSEGEEEKQIYFEDGELYINTLEGRMHVSVGDYVIKGIEDELYPCKPDIFEKTYEIID